MNTRLVSVHTLVAGVLCFVAAQIAIAVPKPTTKTLDGCISRIEQNSSTLSVVPWDGKAAKWRVGEIQQFSYDSNTQVKALNVLTIGQIVSGKALQDEHFTGLFSPGKKYEIKALSGLVGRRAEVHWTDNGGVHRAANIGLVSLFGGESMPAMIGSNSVQAFPVTNDDCPTK